MTKTDLSQKLRDLGEKIVVSLDKTRDKPSSAFWFYSDDNEWILCFVSSESRIGKVSDQNDIADRIQVKISEITPENIPFAVMESDNYLIQAMSNFFITDLDTIGKIEFKNNTIDGVTIRSVYAYRLTK